jgi:hypothetical protein
LFSNVHGDTTIVRVGILLCPHHGLDAAVCRSKYAADREDLA